jgi:hypothetical protein
MNITVNGALCGDLSTQAPNQACVSVTLCTPGCNRQCQTIHNILLDTGSYGLRIFSGAIAIPLKQVFSGSAALAECVQFGDGSSEWGPVEYADVILAGEPAIPNLPILVINSSYASPPKACTSSESLPDQDPKQVGFNGILGVGLFKDDCGSECATDSNNGQYYACTASSGCKESTASLGNQLQNPVALLPQDNNGVILKLPQVGSGGVPSINGSLILGIGTQANNLPQGETSYPVDRNGSVQTQFSALRAQAIPGFIDSGSNTLTFPAPSGLPDCSANQYDGPSGFDGMGKVFYCPDSGTSYSAINSGATGIPGPPVSFTIENAFYLLFSNNSGNNYVFSTLGTSADGNLTGYFDWGLPFFFGKNVYVGIAGTQSPFGMGPYWAY